MHRNTNDDDDPNDLTNEPVYMFRNQNFHAIRDWCLKRGYLFEDPYFAVDDSYEWLRPWEIINDPHLYVGGIARFDIIQGELGDCWMLASISALGMHPGLVKKIIPSDQSFSSQYAGIFHIRFWQFGRWYDVVIDDRLPTVEGKLVYTKSISENEFWTALLEKAYCKILGGDYKVADAGNLCEALEDFTGGVTEQFRLSNVPKNFANVLVKSIARHSLIGCFIDDAPNQSETKTMTGLVKGHSYTVTAANRVNIPGHGNIVLVRVRNPWGQHEWTGPWSDGSPEWASVPASTRQELGIVNRDDGEFWMSYADFVTHFQWLDCCHLSPEVYSDAFGEMENISSWQLSKIKGSWVKGVTAGGARYLHQNPQIRFNLSEGDDEDEDGLCSVVIALFQNRSGCVGDQYEIGFGVYKVNGESVLDESFFHYNRSVASTPMKRVREVSGRFDLPPGDYCIVPFTYEAGKEREFMLRIYSEKGADMDNMDYRIGLSPEDIAKTVDTKPADILGKTMDKPSHKPIDEGVRKFFIDVSGADKQLDWKELKIVLGRVKVANLLDFKDERDHFLAQFHGHFLVDSANYVWNRFFKREPRKNAFLTVSPDGFSKELCRSMVALLDVDHSGKLGLNEFQELLMQIKKWQAIYEEYSDRSDGVLRSSKVKDALEAAGFHFSKQTIIDIVHRYSSNDEKISFDDFLLFSVKIKTMHHLWVGQLKNTKTKNKKAIKAEFTMEEFMDEVLYS